jgi:hypothetical protein
MKVTVAAHCPKAFFGEQERGPGPAQEDFAAAPAFDAPGEFLGAGEAALDRVGRSKGLDSVFVHA